MKNFLKNINATEKLIKEISNSNLNVFCNKENNKVGVSITCDKKISAPSKHEFYTKTFNLLTKLDFEVDFINFQNHCEENILDTYENILEIIKSENINFSKADFYLEDKKDFIILKTSKDNCANFFEKNKDNIFKYCKQLSITNKKIVVDFNINHLSFNKLEDQINKKEEDIIFKKEIIDEKIKKNYKKINFDLKGKQTNVFFEGFVLDIKKIISKKTGTLIYNFILGDGPNAVNVSLFDKEKKDLDLKEGDSYRVYGIYDFNEYKKENVLTAFNTSLLQKVSEHTLKEIIKDDTGLKRHEFNIHTKMSTLDGVANIEDYLIYAKAYNLASLTISDHNSVQSFPSAAIVAKNNKDIKINFGAEFDLFDDLNTKIVINERDQNLLDAEYVFFDLETTSISPTFDEIIEFGAVKYQNNKVIERKQIFIKPSKPISNFTTELTGITENHLKDAPKIEEIISEIKEWIGDAILVAHNASFDYSFLNKAYIDNGLGSVKNPIIDTMKISWLLHTKSRGHRLGVVAKNELVDYDSEAAHRADYDAEVLSKIYERFLQKLLKKDIRSLKTLNSYSSSLNEFFFLQHINVISKNQDGLKELNKLVSKSSVETFNKRKKVPSLPLSMFLEKEKFKNILIGSGGADGFIFDAILKNSQEFIKKIIKIYDYLEVFPLSSYQHLISNGVLDKDSLKEVIRTIIELGNKYNIPVIASSNAYYAGKKDKSFRDVLISAQRVGGGFHPLYNFRNPNNEKPDAHLRSTSEMIEDFSTFLPKDIVMDIVINNPAKLQEKILDQSPIKNKLYTPKIPGAEQKLLSNINKNIKKLYGENIHPLIQERIDQELNSIIKHGFSIIYFLTSLAVKKSMDDGFLVGSRGSVGSSIVATLAEITEVNPLKPHYRCPKCKYHEFDESVSSGFDLEDKKCPKCEELMIGDGHSIPFETFLGFNADKVPDIDINFSRENQSSIHKYMKSVLGEDKVFRAGTISTAAFKTSIGYVRNYEEQKNSHFNRATVEWMATNIEGGKRTTGQHPGGLIIIPQDMDVYDFSPINYPGDDVEADWKTTHFDFHAIHDNLLKLDLLGHLDPSSLRMLQTLTNVNPRNIPSNDKEVISLFKNNKALKYIENFTGEDLGIIGIPEFGTNFVRDLVSKAKPKSFSDLVAVSGLSHGTNVWKGNAEDLIIKGEAVLSEVITVRDDIMTYLIEKGLENSDAFNIMESVRKGKGLNEEWEKLMHEKNVPQWYINSCKAIKYMFPKAHATAYVMMAYRIAWYKINYPLEYYATFFSKRDVEVPLTRILKGVTEIKKHISEIKAIPKFQRQKKDEDILETYNVVLEMYSRGIEFQNISITKSLGTNYTIDHESKSIIPPFSIVEGVGGIVADKIVDRRNEKPYESIADFEARSGISSKFVTLLKETGAFGDLKSSIDHTQQLSLFE